MGELFGQTTANQRLSDRLTTAFVIGCLLMVAFFGILMFVDMPKPEPQKIEIIESVDTNTISLYVDDALVNYCIVDEENMMVTLYTGNGAVHKEYIFRNAPLTTKSELLNMSRGFLLNNRSY